MADTDSPEEDKRAALALLAIYDEMDLLPALLAIKKEHLKAKLANRSARQAATSGNASRAALAMTSLFDEPTGDADMDSAEDVNDGLMMDVKLELARFRKSSTCPITVDNIKGIKPLHWWRQNEEM